VGIEQIKDAVPQINKYLLDVLSGVDTVCYVKQGLPELQLFFKDSYIVILRLKRHQCLR
jgi:hypothetical protein